MLEVPYIEQPDRNACALASYTMVAKYFFPETTLEEIAKISNWEKGYVVWAFKFWFWIMDHGVKVTGYDTLDYDGWARDGIEGLKKSVSPKEFNFYLNNTKDLESYSRDIGRVLAHRNFSQHKKTPTIRELESAMARGNICEVVLDAGTLQGRDEFSLHRVVVLDVSPEEVVYHDPSRSGGSHQKTARDLFEHAWLTAVAESELCEYEKI